MSYDPGVARLMYFGSVCGTSALVLLILLAVFPEGTVFDVRAKQHVCDAHFALATTAADTTRIVALAQCKRPVSEGENRP